MGGMTLSVTDALSVVVVWTGRSVVIGSELETILWTGFEVVVLVD